MKDLPTRKHGHDIIRRAVIAALVIFALSYLVIAGSKLPFVSIDRPSGAFVGATAMVLAGVLTPREAANDAVNWDTILLLLGMMVVTGYLARARVFRWISWKTLTHVHSPGGMLVAVTFVAGGLSAVLVNDTVCLMLTPLVVQLALDAKLKPLPFLLALAFGANAGSLATLTGNPQNMIIGTLSGIEYARFTAALALPALASLVVISLVLLFVFRAHLPARRLVDVQLPRPELDVRRALPCLVAVVGLVVAFLLGYDLAWSAMAAASFLIVFGGKPEPDAFESIDWRLLVFFAGLFVIVHGVAKSGLAEAMFTPLRPLFGSTVLAQSLSFGGFTLVASQLVSNVPFVLLAAQWMDTFADPTFMWLSTALFATLAGNLTPIGSVANIIVIEGARGHERVPFLGFVKVGAVVTLLTLAAAWGVLVFERWAGWL